MIQNERCDVAAETLSYLFVLFSFFPPWKFVIIELFISACLGRKSTTASLLVLLYSSSSFLSMRKKKITFSPQRSHQNYNYFCLCYLALWCCLSLILSKWFQVHLCTKSKVILDSVTMALKIPLACTQYDKITQHVIRWNYMDNFCMLLLLVCLLK